MTHRGKVLLSITWLTNEMKARQLNKFDVNFGVSGKRGDGKSTLLLKLFLRFKKQGFKQRSHQVYSREDVIRLLKKQKFGYCWDDEAINSGYKRDFASSGQKELIKIVTMYRDNFNIYGSAMPFFLSMDKDLRELLFMHIHIIERGLAVVFMPLANSIFTSDPWDIKNNTKIELRENQRLKNQGELINFPYHKFSTFVGYLYFNGMSPKQEEKYLKIKTEKRMKASEEYKVKEEMTFVESCYKMLNDGKLTKEGLIQSCALVGKDYKTTVVKMNEMLIKEGIVDKTVNDMFCIVTDGAGVDAKRKKKIQNLSNSQINDLIPEF